jgi:AP-3 complex subunit delta
MYGVKLLSQQEGDVPSIEVKFVITNKSSTTTLDHLRLTAFDTNVFVLENAENASSRNNVSARATVEVVNRLTMNHQPEEFSNIALGYDLQYDFADESSTHLHFNVEITVATFMLDNAQLDPNGFANMLSERGHEFSHQSSATLILPIPNDKPREDVLTNGLEVISTTTRLHIVEMVPGAASLYGKSVQGIEVAGLLKYSITGEEEDQFATMRLELKCTDHHFVEAMASKVSNLS